MAIYRLVSDEMTWIHAILRQIPGAQAAAWVGSSTRQFSPEPGDLDLLVITDVPRSLATLQETAECLVARDPAEPRQWVISEDTIRTRWAGHEVGIACIDDETFRRETLDIMAGLRTAPEYRSWTVFGFAREVRLADLCDARIIFEQRGILSQWQAILASYPETLRTALLRHCTVDLQHKLALSSCALRVGDLTTVKLSLAAAILPLVRAMCALDRVYFRGMKHLESQIAWYLPQRMELILQYLSAPLTESRTAILRQVLHESSSPQDGMDI